MPSATEVGLNELKPIIQRIFRPMVYSSSKRSDIKLQTNIMANCMHSSCTSLYVKWTHYYEVPSTLIVIMVINTLYTITNTIDSCSTQGWTQVLGTFSSNEPHHTAPNYAKFLGSVIFHDIVNHKVWLNFKIPVPGWHLHRHILFISHNDDPVILAHLF